MPPPWQVPHAFGLIPLEGDTVPLPPMPVFTLGPIVADLAALAEPTRDTVIRLGRSLGFEWLASLVKIDRPDGVDEPELAVFLRERLEVDPSERSNETELTIYLEEQYALRPGVAPNPFGVRAGELVRRRPHGIPNKLISRFVANEAGRLEYIGSSLRRLVGPVLATAKGQPKPSDRQQQRTAELLNALDTPMRVRRFYNPKNETSVYRLTPPNLYARALLELIELYNEMPPVAICKRCDRLFVPQHKGEKYCRRYIWPASGGENIAGCVYDDNPTPTRARLNSDARRNEYKKLQMRVVRFERDLGANHATTKKARRQFAEWKRANPVDRGRRPTPMPPDLLPYRYPAEPTRCASD